MRLTVLAAVFASVAMADPAAKSWDTPIRVINEKNQVRWSSDGGVCLSPPAWATVDGEFRRLQALERLHNSESSPGKWFLAGMGAGAAIVIGAAAAVYAVTR